MLREDISSPEEAQDEMKRISDKLEQGQALSNDEVGFLNVMQRLEEARERDRAD